MKQDISFSDKTDRVLQWVVIILLFVAFITPVYVNLYGKKPTSRNLFVAVEEQQIPLGLNTGDFDSLTTYHPKNNNPYSGEMIVSLSNPSSANFQIINQQNQIVSTSVNKTHDKLDSETISFNNKAGGPITLQFKNSLEQNYITRIDIIIN